MYSLESPKTGDRSHEPRGEQVRRFDVHSHYFSPRVLDELERIGERCGTPSVRRPDGGMFVHTPERPYGPLIPAFYDLEERIAYMDANGIGGQLLVPPPFLFLYWSDTAEARTLMRLENDGLALAARHPSRRFCAFGTVMLQDVPASIEECKRMKEIGLLGVEIGSNVCDRGLDDRNLLPFFETLEILDMPLLIHPHNVAGQDRMADFHLRNLLGFPLDTTLAAAQLIFSGLLDRFPKVRICLGQAGGFLPFIIGRLDAGFRARPECRRYINSEPSHYLRRFYYDTIIHSRRSAAFLINVIGAERLMFGTDFPFDMNSTSPVAEIEGQVNLTPQQCSRIFSGTAAEYLGDMPVLG
jgi:aminocarboxymuconate-semialdehyde decarboxylase